MFISNLIMNSSQQTQKGNEMNNYQASITKNSDNTFYALVVRIDRDGQQNVIHGYKGRHFSTAKAAEKSTAAYISKWHLGDR